MHGAAARPTLKWVVALLGGKVYEAARRRPTYKAVAIWWVNGAEAAAALAAIRPMLRIKRAEAAVASVFARAVANPSRAKHTARKRAQFARLKARIEQIRRDAKG